MFRNVMMAAALASGFAGAAAAHEVRILTNGENFEVERLGDDGTTVVGGAQLRVTGNGEGYAVEVIGTPNAQGPAISRFIGQGENTSVEFLPPRG